MYVHIYTPSHITYWIPVITFPHTSETQYFQTKFVISLPKLTDVTVGVSVSSSFPGQQEQLFSVVLSLPLLHIQSVAMSHAVTLPPRKSLESLVTSIPVISNTKFIFLRFIKWKFHFILSPSRNQ